jgi:RNA polymerase sigma factor (sigma-70 family)
MADHLAPPQSDRELLARFVGGRDEAAFAALVHRHGPTVYGVCRRVLGNPADADDAFQAVFLVLVNRADALAHRPALGGWLHEVAVRVAMKARTALARLRKHERGAAEARAESAFDPPPHDPPAWLDREVAALPDRLREPVVRCLIQDRPRSEVAAELGIPEGTLASRLDTARKRLAERLARHHLPLALGGLLVPVPAALASAAVRRATDGAGVVIHQLANEVTKAMCSHTIRAAVVAVGVLMLMAVAGGLLLGGAGDPPVARQTPPVPKPKEAKEPPEPAWAKAFNKVYRLDDGQYVKRVPKPLPPERAEFFLTHFYKTIGTEREERSRLEFSRWSDFCTLFVEQDGRTLTYLQSISSAYLQSRPELQRGDNLLTAWDLVTLVTGREEPEVVIHPDAKGDPLFETGNLTVSGDFVIRKDAPLERLAPQLEKILREECRLDVRLTLKKEEQPVFVVSGTFKLTPPAWRDKDAKEVDVFATEDGLNKEHQFANFDAGRERAAHVKTLTYSGTPVGFVRFLGDRVKTRMVWDADLPAGPKFSWHNHTLRNPTKEDEATDRDPEKVLKVVAEQTGLTFKKDRRQVAVLYVSTPQKK